MEELRVGDTVKFRTNNLGIMEQQSDVKFMSSEYDVNEGDTGEYLGTHTSEGLRDMDWHWVGVPHGFVPVHSSMIEKVPD